MENLISNLESLQEKIASGNLSGITVAEMNALECSKSRIKENYSNISLNEFLELAARFGMMLKADETIKKNTSPLSRVQQEEQLIASRMNSLRRFCLSSEFYDLSKEHQRLLWKQLHIMEAYRDCLIERLKMWEKKQ